jgi:hypothetical protein
MVINYDWSKPSTSSNHHQSSCNLIARKDFQFQDHFVYLVDDSQGSLEVEEPMQNTQAVHWLRADYALGENKKYLIHIIKW